MALPPGPKLPAPLITLSWLRRPYPFLDETAARFGDTFTIHLVGLPPLVFFSNPDHVREVFQDDGEVMAAGRFNRSLAPLLGDRSVLMTDGAAHRRKRKLLMPPFHGERMQAYGRAMLELTDRAIDGMPRDEPFALHSVMQDITLHVIVRTVFGLEDGPKFREMCERLKRILELGAWAPLLLPFMQVDLGNWSPYGRFRAAVRAGDELFYADLRARRASGERGADILSLLLDARDEDGEPIGDDELRDELVTLLVAGHETTATALTWAMRWLLSQPSTFADLRAEVDTLGEHPTPEGIAKLELLDAAAREALRLVPVIPLVGRYLQRPIRLGGHDLPEGCVVCCSIYLAHRRPDVWDRPAEFDPTRFLGKKFSPAEFLPFGGGIRRCIGAAFALYEMKMVLARLVAGLDLRLAGRREVRMVRRAITITPSEGLTVTARPRVARATKTAQATVSA